MTNTTTDQTLTQWAHSASAPSAEGALPPTSLIICSRNRPQLLLESVESVLQGDETPTEILIMDQSDTPHSLLANLTTARECAIRYQRTSSIGECPARNEGIGLARYDLLVFTDDDVIVPAAWFGTLVRALLKAGRRSVVTGRVLPSQPDTAGGFAPTVKLDTNPAVYAGRPGEDVLFPMNMAFYRTASDEVGGFDVRFGAGGPFRGAEDNDMGFRFLEAGYRIVYAPEAMLYHRAWRTIGDYLPLRWSYGYCQGAFYAKHLSLKDPYMLQRMKSDIGRHTFRLIRYLGRRSRRQTFADALYVLGVMYGATKWLVTQRKTP